MVASLFALLSAPTVASAKAAGWVIPSEGEGVLRSALGERPVTGLVLRTAAIDKAHVVLSYGPPGQGPASM